MRQFEVISLNQARQFATSPDYIVIDLRTPKEYEEKHVAHAINLPNGNIRTIERMQKKNKIWILYCRRGSMSFRLASEMASRGYRVMAVAGGLDIAN